VPACRRAVKRLKALQDVLGELHDMETLENRIKLMVRKAG
jgi:CHAD domain-containing protein